MSEEHKHHEEHKQHHQHEVDIIIDRKHLKSPRETTGGALYTLGEVPAGYVLYLETPGPEEDAPIKNDGARVELHEHAKLYSTPGKVTPGSGI
jgi:hypothetical protein